MGIEEFLNKKNKIAVVGVSSDYRKTGYKFYTKLKSKGYDVYAINPKNEPINGDMSYKELKDLPEKPGVVVTTVRPEITEKIVKECIDLGINKIWMQPGSESYEAVKLCKENNIEVMYHVCFFLNGLGERLLS